MQIRLGLLSLFLFCTLCSCQENSPPLDSREAPYSVLSDWNFFSGELADLTPNEEVVPYTLNSTLFSDYSEKARFIHLAKGSQITFDENDQAVFPDGAIIIKNFFYYHNAGQPQEGRRIIETRLLLKELGEWEVANYIWNEAQAEAHLEILGGSTDVAWIDRRGEQMQVHYQIPDNNDCKSCHLQAGEVRPIGPKLHNLNLTLATGENQLDFLVKKGLVAARKDAWSPHMVDYNDVEAPLHDRALAYLDINCAHCHGEQGPASNTGLFLHYDQDDPFRIGLMKTPVSAAQGSGGYDYNVVPGDPDRSILLYRMKSSDTGIAMPEVGRSLPHLEGIALIERWIKSLPSDS